MNTLNPIIRFALICGITFAIYVIVGRFAWEVRTQYITVMSNVSASYINQSSSGLSPLIFGAIWAFLDGFILGGLFAWIRSQLP